MDAKKILEKGAEMFLPNLSIDLVIVGYDGDGLKCLLLRVGEKWVLPGGYVKRDESVESAMRRTLKERTSLENPFYKFLAVFGNKERHFGQEFKSSFAANGIPWDESYWINDRFVTLSYYSLVNMDETHPSISGFDEEFGWFSFKSLPPMWMDHKEIVLTARKQLKKDIDFDLLTPNLLPPQFTMPQLHRLHEAIRGETLDRSRFQKRMLATGQLERLSKLKKDTRGSNPYQYKVKKE